MNEEPVVPPGTYPVEMLDQRMVWVGTDGFARPITTLAVPDVLYAIDYSLANATMLREKWAFAKQANYDSEEKARRWMLIRPAIRALMRRLVELEDEFDIPDP